MGGFGGFLDKMSRSRIGNVQKSIRCAYYGKSDWSLPMDHDTVASLLIRERSRLYAYIWSFVHDPEMAEDVFQDVCLLAIRESDKIESESHIQSWFRRVARQRAVDSLRRRHRAPVVLDAVVLDALDSHWAHEDAAPASTLTAALHRCVERLTSRAKEIIKLRYVDGLSAAKVAETLGAQVDAIYKSLWRIHRKLGDCVEQRVSQEEKAVESD
jgi:RNA polymerase sigma-70 factor, ECF subfamily